MSGKKTHIHIQHANLICKATLRIGHISHKRAGGGIRQTIIIADFLAGLRVCNFDSLRFLGLCVWENGQVSSLAFFGQEGVEKGMKKIRWRNYTFYNF